MTLHIPQLLMLGMIVLSLGVDAERNGKPKTGKHDFWSTLIASLITFGILYWGGFFK